MRRRLACLALVFAAGCLEVEPPAGQFFCATPADCPDGWVCGSDALCYPEPLACYPYDQTSCPAGQGCYPLGGGAGTICWPAGPVAENAPCDDSMQATRCGIGFRCVSRADGDHSSDLAPARLRGCVWRRTARVRECTTSRVRT